MSIEARRTYSTVRSWLHPGSRALQEDLASILPWQLPPPSSVSYFGIGFAAGDSSEPISADLVAFWSDIVAAMTAIFSLFGNGAAGMNMGMMAGAVLLLGASDWPSIEAFRTSSTQKRPGVLSGTAFRPAPPELLFSVGKSERRDDLGHRPDRVLVPDGDSQRPICGVDVLTSLIHDLEGLEPVQGYPFFALNRRKDRIFRGFVQPGLDVFALGLVREALDHYGLAAGRIG
jgi:hypothetical protein